MLYSQKVRTQHVSVYSVNILLLAYQRLCLVQHCRGADQRDWCKWTALSQQDKCPERETNREECKTSTITTGKHSDLHLHLVLRHWFQGTKLTPTLTGVHIGNKRFTGVSMFTTFSMLVNTQNKVVQEQWPHSPYPVIRVGGDFLSLNVYSQDPVASQHRSLWALGTKTLVQSGLPRESSAWEPSSPIPHMENN